MNAIASSTLPPAQPVYILRGHASAIHAVLFTHSNVLLISGDADGFVIIWNLVTKRPLAVWKAHESTILGLDSWGVQRLISHGRDGKIYVWSLASLDVNHLNSDLGFSTTLPADGKEIHRKQPWLLHILEVTTLNFCSFASCNARQTEIVASAMQDSDPDESVKATQPKFEPESSTPETTSEFTSAPSDPDKSEALILAVCGKSDSEIELYQLPTAQQIALIPAPIHAGVKAGMVMALRLVRTSSDQLLVIAGYENGSVSVYKLVREARSWVESYSKQPHSQPILSLDVCLTKNIFYTSSADAIVAKHTLCNDDEDIDPPALKVANTKHAGQQGLSVRSDGKIFATAGWDGRIRVYSVKTMKELAVLKWHKEGCYASAFAAIGEPHQSQTASTPGPESLIEQSTSQALIQKNRQTSKLTVAEAREAKVKTTHWLAAGSKDGKISLWDIY